MKKVINMFMAVFVAVTCFCSSPNILNKVSADDVVTSAWSASSDNSDLLFYVDSNEKAPGSYEENKVPYSLAIRNISGSRTAYYEKTFQVQTNTYYVMNAFVKSSFIALSDTKTGFNTKEIMPTTIKVINGDDYVESRTSIGQVNEWQEISVGFNTGNSTSVKIQLSVDFSTKGTVWFDNIRLDKPETTKVLMLAYDKINAVYDNVTYSSVRDSNITETVIINTMKMFDDMVCDLSNHKIITETTVVSPGTLSNLHFSGDRMYANYEDVRDYVENQPQEYDFVFVLMPANAGTYIEGKTPYMGICYASQALANVDQGLVTGSLPTDYNAPVDGLVHEFIHYIDYKSNQIINTDMPYIDEYESGRDYNTTGSKSIVIDDITYDSYYHYYTSGILDNNKKNYEEIWNKNTSPVYQSFNVKYQWYYDYLNGQVQHYDSGFWGMRSLNILKSGTISQYHMSTNFVQSGVYNLKNSHYTSTPYLKESETVLSHVSESTKINEYWNILCVDGYYEITPLNNPSLRLTVDTLSLSSQPNKGTIKLSTANDSDSQKWLIIKVTENEYKIVSKLDTSRCFEYAYGGTVNEAQMWVYGGGNNQKWCFEEVVTLSENIFNMSNKYYNKYIRLNNDSSVSLTNTIGTFAENWAFESVGTYFKIRPSNNYSTPLTVENISLPENSAKGEISFTENCEDLSQLWIVVKLNDNSYRITSALNPNKCFEYGYGGTVNKAQLWDFVDGTNQKWTLTSNNSAITQTMKNTYYNQYLSVGLKMVNSGCSWTIKPSENYYIISNTSGRLTYDGDFNGSKVEFDNSTSVTDNQKWILKVTTEGNYIISPLTNPDMCMEFSYGGSNNQLQLWKYVGGDNQKWILN